MLIAKTIAELRVHRATLTGRVGFVPTMGALHDGHRALLSEAKAQSDVVVASIFVNPTQFGEAADLANYPRSLEQDLDILRRDGVSLVFVPEVEAIYPDGAETIVETTKLANMLHGEVRPGHFRGVTTVVAKLFNLVQPDIACFGEKDYQQLAVIRRMTRDLHFPIEIIGVPTHREPDGLAMSSRNRRLTAEDRRAAVVLYQALTMAQRAGGVDAVNRIIRDHIATEPRANLQGLDIVDPGTLAPPHDQPGAEVAVMISAFFGDILLIDQKVIQL